MTKPRVYTPDEVRDMLMDYIWGTVDYWDTVEGERDQRSRLAGLAFTLLSTLDGCSAELPGFLVTPMPHETDKDYHQEEGQNWFPEDKPDLGMLHEYFGSRDPRKKP